MGKHDHKPQNLGELSYDNLPWALDLSYEMQTLLYFHGFGYREVYSRMADRLEAKGWKVRDTEFTPTCDRIAIYWEAAAWNLLGRPARDTDNWPPGYQKPTGDIFSDDYAQLTNISELDQRGPMPEERVGPWYAEGEDAWCTFGDLNWMACCNMARTLYNMKLINLLEKMVWMGSHGGRPRITVP